MKTLNIIALLLPLILNVNGYEKHENCGGKQRESEVRIYSGSPLRREEYEQPWLVALHNRILNSFFCAGSLISNKHVLTGKWQNKCNGHLADCYIIAMLMVKSPS